VPATAVAASLPAVAFPSPTDAGVTEAIRRHSEAASALDELVGRQSDYDEAEHDWLCDNLADATWDFVATVPANMRSLAEMLRHIRGNELLSADLCVEEFSVRFLLSVEEFACSAAGLPEPSGD